MRTLSLIAAAIALVAALPVASASDPLGGKEICVNYAYVADYQWHYLCADPTNEDCPVSTMVSNGYSRHYTCYGGGVTLTAEPICTPETGDMDYRWSVCVSTNVKCPVYVQYTNGGKDCLP